MSDVSTFVLLSHEQALRRQLDIAASNMANVNTAGYKREQAQFREHVERTRHAPVADARRTSFVLDRGVVHDARAGSFETSGNPLDVMVEGPGHLSVRTPEGGIAYTRAGQLRVREDGTLVTAAGRPVLGENGATITVPEDQIAGLAIAADGTIASATGTFGRLTVTVMDEMRVSARGDGMSEGAGGRILARGDTHLRSGGFETSNVQPIVETTTMIGILRAYQSSMQMSADLDSLRRQAIDRLSRVE